MLADAGIWVQTYDAHGHGKSDPLDVDSRAFVQSYTHLVDDLCDYMDSVAAAGAVPPGTPVFLLGHSMGGLVAALACVRRQERVAGLMLHSPALDVEWTAVLRVQAMMGGLLAALVPRARLVPAVRPEDMSQDPQVVADYIADPLNTVGPVRARTGNEMLRAFRDINAAAARLTLPVYACHGTRDACTSAAASRRFVEGPGGVGGADRVFRSVEGGYHELLHGPEWEACTRELLEWMRTRGAGGAGAAGAGAVGAGAGAEVGGAEGAGAASAASGQSRL